MSITRFTSALAALVTAMVLAPNVHAQLFKPLEFPGIESDFQFFAPADVDTFGGGPKHKTGWFATYDRVYMNVQRPSDAYNQSETYGDFTWGNRFDVGYIDDKRKGWLVTGWHIDGPNENNVLLVERMNRFMTDASPETTALNPLRDNNLRLSGDRDYLVYNSINVADLSSIEINRTWLWKPLHKGASLQPFAGFRYMKFVDFYQRDTYNRYDENGSKLNPFGPPILFEEATTEELDSLRAGFTNEMVGGQLGIRWDKNYRRWNFSGDVKAFALQNFQNYNWVRVRERTDYGDTLPDDTQPVTVVYEDPGGAAHSAEFVFGMEVRAEAAYQLTRDFSLRVGFEFMDLGQGIGRGFNPAENDQAVILYGMTFGATLNR